MTLVRSFAVVPAAGASRRMGCSKLLLPWRDKTVIETVLDTWKRSGVTVVTTVLKVDDDQLVAHCRAAGVEVLLAETPPADMKGSIRLALKQIAKRHKPSLSDVWLVAPADIPELSAEIIQRLLAEYDPARPEILIPTWHAKRGHPALFPWSLAERVGRLGVDEGVDRLFAECPVREVPTAADAVPADLDTPSDYSRRPR